MSQPQGILRFKDERRVRTSGGLGARDIASRVDYYYLKDALRSCAKSRAASWALLMAFE